jgi:glycosyltransferase involved in cell wall biosynthesis
LSGTVSKPIQTMAGSGQPKAAGGPVRPAPSESTSHLIVIPSFDSGDLLADTIAAARRFWAPVWVVIDGSTDHSWAAAEVKARMDPALRVLRLTVNSGKGAAVGHALAAADACGFTHVLVMDADGQHPAERIPDFMAASRAAPGAVVAGRPVFGPDAPWERVVARRLCNWCAALEAMRDVGDTLFGFRVYPIAPLLAVMRESRGMRRFDFDPEAMVRLAWEGRPLIRLPAPVRYLTPAQGGVSHFRYVRDNRLLVRMHGRLLLTAFGRWLRRDRLTDRKRRTASRSVNFRND